MHASASASIANLIDMMQRWLLLLGSNLASDDAVRTALARLSDFGTLAELTKIRKFASHDGKRRPYYNSLVSLESRGERDEVVAGLKQIERELGRGYETNDTVTIDLDILASLRNSRWIPDPHASQKREFEHSPVVVLLREAGICIVRNGL